MLPITSAEDITKMLKPQTQHSDIIIDELPSTLHGNCPVTDSLSHNQINLDLGENPGYEMNSQSSLPVCLR